MDLLEIPKKGHLLVVVHYYSKWSEIAFVTKNDAGTVTVLNVWRACFALMVCLKPSGVIMVRRFLHENSTYFLSTWQFITRKASPTDLKVTAK